MKTKLQLSCFIHIISILYINSLGIHFSCWYLSCIADLCGISWCNELGDGNVAVVWRSLGPTLWMVIPWPQKAQTKTRSLEDVLVYRRLGGLKWFSFQAFLGWQVGSFIPLFTRFYIYPKGGWPWDFWSINSRRGFSNIFYFQPDHWINESIWFKWVGLTTN